MIFLRKNYVCKSIYFFAPSFADSNSTLIASAFCSEEFLPHGNVYNEHTLPTRIARKLAHIHSVDFSRVSWNGPKVYLLLPVNASNFSYFRYTNLQLRFVCLAGVVLTILFIEQLKFLCRHPLMRLRMRSSPSHLKLNPTLRCSSCFPSVVY